MALAGISASDASARGHGGGGGHAHFGGGGRAFGHVGHVGGWGGRGVAFHHHHHRGVFFGPRFGYYGYGYPYYAYYDNGCSQWLRVPTRYGWRLRRAWVCGPRYY